jgi:hypothetical protein
LALPYKSTKVTIFGTSFQGTEIWSTGFHMGDPTGDSLPPTELGAAYIAAQWKIFFQTANSAISNKWFTTGVKLATIGTDGKTVGNEVAYHYEATPYSGAGSTHFPAQCALVATLTTAVPRGLASKGRMYLPGVAAAITDAGKLSNTVSGAVATNLKTFFDSVNASIDATGSVITASPGSKPPLVGAGVFRPVTGVRVGDVIDTQRRRRNQLVEIYENRNLAA